MIDKVVRAGSPAEAAAKAVSDVPSGATLIDPKLPGCIYPPAGCI